MQGAREVSWLDGIVQAALLGPPRCDLDMTRGRPLMLLLLNPRFSSGRLHRLEGLTHFAPSTCLPLRVRTMEHSVGVSVSARTFAARQLPSSFFVQVALSRLPTTIFLEILLVAGL